MSAPRTRQSVGVVLSGLVCLVALGGCASPKLATIAPSMIDSLPRVQGAANSTIRITPIQFVTSGREAVWELEVAGAEAAQVQELARDLGMLLTAEWGNDTAATIRSEADEPIRFSRIPPDFWTWRTVQYQYYQIVDSTRQPSGVSRRVSGHVRLSRSNVPSPVTVELKGLFANHGFGDLIVLVFPEHRQAE